MNKSTNYSGQNYINIITKSSLYKFYMKYLQLEVYRVNKIGTESQ